jgi:hypothetical protein
MLAGRRRSGVGCKFRGRDSPVDFAGTPPTRGLTGHLIHASPRLTGTLTDRVLATMREARPTDVAENGHGRSRLGGSTYYRLPRHPLNRLAGGVTQYGHGAPCDGAGGRTQNSCRNGASAARRVGLPERDSSVAECATDGDGTRLSAVVREFLCRSTERHTRASEGQRTSASRRGALRRRSRRPPGWCWCSWHWPCSRAWSLRSRCARNPTTCTAPGPSGPRPPLMRDRGQHRERCSRPRDAAVSAGPG